MCSGCDTQQEIYSDCHHYKRTTTIKQCLNHPNPTWYEEAQARQRTLYVINPGLCRKCYCAKEEIIFKYYDILSELYDLLRLWPRNVDGDVVVDVQGQLIPFLKTTRAVEIFPLDDYSVGQVFFAYDSQQHIIDQREIQLARFRQRQGVWGDG